MGRRYLIDSNIIIDYAANKLPGKTLEFVEQLFLNDFLISVVVKIEVLGFNEAEEKQATLEAFLNTATSFPLDDAIAVTAIQLRKARKLKLGDAIIAATALTHNLTLLTRNINDFKPIASLDLLNPWDLP
ncbi:MAG: type II toxin-antitoxin system VapC family toxin [Chitinophagales bacterium]|nr:type II toxin-antitoxin system VapC family toxin [Chitinophagales bacterium]